MESFGGICELQYLIFSPWRRSATVRSTVSLLSLIFYSCETIIISYFYNRASVFCVFLF
uniref:Uncharacterized protein n=1 Tax=Manihot esculenta TaxID=3983 RepID=A0A2C9VEZ0_MANES